MNDLPRHRALALLTKCVGDEIWALETCRRAGVPDSWIDELADAFESGYSRDSDTIYLENTPTNQYHGVRDLDLAIRLGRCLGVDVDRATSTSLGRRGMVNAIKEAVMDGE